MPLTGNVGHDIKTEMAHGKSHDQAVAIAMSMKDKKKKNGSKNYSKGAVEMAAKMKGVM